MNAEQLAESDIEPVSKGLAEKFFGTSILMNIITVLLLLFLLFVVFSIVLCCKYTIMPRCPGCFSTILAKIERKLFWNSVLRAFLETYYSVSIFFFFSMSSISTQSQDAKSEFMTWLATGLFLFGFPIFTFRLLFNKQDQLATSETRERFDSLY